MALRRGFRTLLQPEFRSSLKEEVRVILDGSTIDPHYSQGRARHLCRELQYQPHFFHNIRELARKAGMAQPPDVVIIPDEVKGGRRLVTARVTKRRDPVTGRFRPTIVVTPALLHVVSENVVKGFVAHEFGHIVADHVKSLVGIRGEFRRMAQLYAKPLTDRQNRQWEMEADRIGAWLTGDLEAQVEGLRDLALLSPRREDPTLKPSAYPRPSQRIENLRKHAQDVPRL